MTLIIAADTQDHLILAGDHCAVMSRVSNQEAPDLVIDNYRKVYPWKYGAIAASGDVFLVAYFHRLFFHYESRGQAINLSQIAKQAKAMSSRAGISRSGSTGNLFFTSPGREGFKLHALYIKADRVDYEAIDLLSTRFSMPENAVDDSACSAFNGRLRPALFFSSLEAFYRHHLDLLKRFFAEQGAASNLVTPSFDVCMLEKHTGKGLFWRVSKTPKQYIHLNLESVGGDALADAVPFDRLREF